MTAKENLRCWLWAVAVCMAIAPAAALAASPGATSIPVPTVTILQGDVVSDELVDRRAFVASDKVLRNYFTSREAVVGKVARRVLPKGPRHSAQRAARSVPVQGGRDASSSSSRPAGSASRRAASRCSRACSDRRSACAMPIPASSSAVTCRRTAASRWEQLTMSLARTLVVAFICIVALRRRGVGGGAHQGHHVGARRAG